MSAPEKSPDNLSGPLAGLRVLELADEKGQFCGKLLADHDADVIKIEPPGGCGVRRVGPFLGDLPHPDRSLTFWYYNTSKRGITLDLERAEGARLFRQLAAGADVILETWAPGRLIELGLGYEALSKDNPGLIVCSLTPFGQTGPWRDYKSSDLVHMAAGGEMASCGYDEEDVPGAPPIAPGGGNAWHMGGHYAYMAILAALVHRTVSGEGQYIDASIHEACALTTESAIANYIYRGETLKRHTGRHHSPGPAPRTQFRAKDGRYVNALVSGRLNPGYMKELAAFLGAYGMAADLDDPKYQDPKVIEASTSHIIDQVVANFIASLPAEEVYHAAQERGFTWAAVRAAEDLVEDAHLADRGFWKTVDHPELGGSFVYPGEAAIFNGSPWRISRRAPLVGEHNVEILCGELGLSRAELALFDEQEVI
jgi:crotonobetainyl-CoA:carnitine CoA-transferase CaiB-like acyl-CoA transferase